MQVEIVTRMCKSEARPDCLSGVTHESSKPPTDLHIIFLLSPRPPATMVDAIVALGLSLGIVAPTAVSVTTGVAQGVSEQHKQNADAANQTRMLKFHIDIHLDEKRRKGKAAALHDGIITLHSDKLWIEPKDPDTGWPVDSTHHPFTGFYLAYPDDNRPSTRGMVSTITVDPPMLNWLYIDNTTYVLSYANRSGSIAHHVGSFDWTSEDNDSSITFDGWEGFVAVEEAEGKWALYFDMDDDGLKAKRKGKKVVDVSLVRRVVTGQEVNKWGLKEAGNMGFRATKEIDKISGKNKE
ncbi:hypothetical protein LTR91_014598 [Friedmanniomyces endolithicus]|uniref:Uncharacterized protein n=2 Tax=Friedmanniomyces endolithicus TaxID=329885 RepID=A0AAN6F711_9PEZI|nr:hypothetical protein LTS09_005014 [Friedmanniomyces endolithicus]KAK0306992.1 hypothetical protein LTR82_016123 [Friedmanniomyces endolithicus]KAK0919763.1 hypothetical protein LTR57_010388 [Friedmanniomyces endolithicus]KAK0969768.1 hypothetical protein LTS01_016086 [Friedmanniomyces endolithicus]KAK0973850.1 hypothetical protein LTR91_014598 [Friedmanniomyces endolithicus]